MAVTTAAPLTLTSETLAVTIELSPDAPARLTSLRVAGGANAVRPHPLVEVLTAAERHDRMTLGTMGTAIGARLRPEPGTGVTLDGADDGPVRIVQRDPVTGLRVVTTVGLVDDGIRILHEARNDGAGELVLYALPTLSVRTAADPASLELVSGRSEWLGEGRWTREPVDGLLPELGFAAVRQPDRTGYGQVSTGGWSTGSVLPTAALAPKASDAATGASDVPGIAWQIESSAGWQWSLSRGDGGVVVTAGGPTEREHAAEIVLPPGASAMTVPAALVVGSDVDGLFAALTRLRRGIRMIRPIDRTLPVVYNDYMNTLMGQPSTEALRPLIREAAAAGAEYFCIDAGWFTDETDYWDAVGEWADAPTRFTDGLGAVLDEIRAAGMRPGIWLEPESVGLRSPMIDELPDDAFFVRRGVPVVQQRRRHLDLRHPAARAHLDAVVDRLVTEHGIAFIKVDYNIEPGTGTDAGGLAPGQGLLAHTRALRSWLEAVQARHPDLLIENCASGAMRSDYHLLAVTHVQSTSDQQDAARYAAIAAAAPATVLPEQAGNWAYPAAEMSAGELAVTLVNGLSGRFYLAGFLDRLGGDARALVHGAVALAKSYRSDLAEAVPFWPLGLHGWDDAVLALGHRLPGGSARLSVWSRGEGGTLTLPGSTATQVFPHGGAWHTHAADGAVTIEVPPGPDAAVFEIRDR